MFWQIMKPGGGGEPTGALAQAITAELGGFAAFKEAFNKAGAARFGSGWAWLVRGKDGKLAVTSTANQDNPLMEGQTPDPGRRRLGARLLPQVPEPPPGLPRRLVEHRQLGGGRPTVRGRSLVIGRSLRVGWVQPTGVGACHPVGCTHPYSSALAGPDTNDQSPGWT